MGNQTSPCTGRYFFSFAPSDPGSNGSNRPPPVRSVKHSSVHLPWQRHQQDQGGPGSRPVFSPAEQAPLPVPSQRANRRLSRTADVPMPVPRPMGNVRRPSRSEKQSPSGPTRSVVTKRDAHS